MKNLIKLFVLAVVVLGFSATSFGQSSATASASGTIVTPIAIAKTVDMNFGNIAVQTSTGGTVVLTPAGVRSATAGVTASATMGGTITAASFDVTGQGNYTYSITLPSTHTVKRNSGTETMTVGTFTSTPSATGTLSSGAQTLNVGATLTVGAGQVAGTYTSETPFTVTVNYN